MFDITGRFHAWRRDPLLRTVLANSSYLFSSNTATIVLSMAQGIFAARLLSPEGYGLLAATVIPFVSTVNRLFSFRMSELVVKYMGEHLAEGKRELAAAVVKGALLTDVAASLLSFGVVLLTAPLAASLIAKDPQSAPFFSFYGLVLISLATYETASGVLQAANRFRAIAIISLLQGGITAGTIFVAYLLNLGLLEVLLAYLLGKSFAGLATTATALAEIRRSLGADWWRAPLRALNLRPLARFALSTNLTGTLNLITRDSETLWVATLRSPVEAGFLKIALSVINLVMLPIQPLIGPTYTEIASALARKRWDAATLLLRRVTTLSGIWTVTTAAGLTLFGTWVIGLYGQEYISAYPALILLLIGFGVANILYWNRPVLLALGLPTYPVKMAALFGTGKILLAILLVPRYGYVAEAALLSAFFVLTIAANVRRGLREMEARQADSAVPEAPLP